MTTAVLVHGGWHSASCWDLVRAELTAAGVPSLAPQLPMSSTLDVDAAALRQVLDDLGDDAVVVAHSWGGSPVTLGCSGAPNVRHLIYVTAFMFAEAGKPSMVDLRTLPPSPGLTVGPVWSHVNPDGAVERFYHDVDPQVAADTVAQLLPFACAGWDWVQTDVAPAWQQVPSTYVICAQDRAIDPAAQREMAKNASETVEIDTSHSPFLSRPDLVAGIIAERVRRYAAGDAPLATAD